MATLRTGNGSDGSITISSNKNIHTDIIAAGRSYADGIAYRITSLTTTSAGISGNPDGIEAGDSVILINLYGKYYRADFANAGNYEILTVDSVSNGIINFTTEKTNYYGSSGSDSDLANHPVMIQRVPNYVDVTLDAGIDLTCNNTNSSATGIGGLICFKASGTVNISGRVYGTGKGPYGGGTGHGHGYGVGGGLGSGGTGSGWTFGAGAGHAAAGQNSEDFTGGPSYGAQEIIKLHVGSGGGAGRTDWANPVGGRGGGAVFISCHTLNVYSGGTIIADGTNASTSSGRHGGSGSGGSVLLHVSNIDTKSGQRLLSQGATDYANGSNGRIAVYYRTITDAQANPTAYTELIELPYFIQGSISEDAQVRVYNTVWGLETSGSFSEGNYQLDVSGLGPFHVVGMPTSSGIGSLIYRDVVASQ